MLLRASRSSTIALSGDRTLVALVNQDDDSLSLFQTSDDERIARVPTGDEPSSVVIAPDDRTAYVANRADGTVVRVVDLGAGTAVDAAVDVGSEPVGLALSPTGARLFVAEMAEGRVSVVDTATMEVSGYVDVDRPRALLVTNDGDREDDDETLLVTEFFGRPVAGGEARDTGRTGAVRRFALAGLEAQSDIALAPIDSGFHLGGDPARPTLTTAPNQLAALAAAGGRVYVTSVSASPEGPFRHDNNVYPVVYVADLASGEEVRGAAGSTNLARAIYDALPAASPESPRFVPGDLSDIDFVPDTTVSYAIGRAADLMVRVDWAETGVAVGSTQNTVIDLGGNDTLGRCQGPTGVVVDEDALRAYVNCWVSRRLAVVDLASQAMARTSESAPAPATAAEQAIARGRRFYFTGRGRWSFRGDNGAVGGEGWSSCGSCHPDGLTDNITWSFNAGPRQSTSQDGSFSHGPGAQVQRVFNWTGIFDEHHDFERNTRDVSGGLGAITTAASPEDCNQLDKETQVSLAPGGTPIGGLATPLKVLADDPAVALCGHRDWDDVDAFVRAIRPARARRAADPGSVERGRALFADGGCAKCHGGPGWTISRRFWTPSVETNGDLANTDFERPAFFPATWTYDNGDAPRKLASAQPAIAAADVTGPAEPAAIPIAEIACVLRNVGTFGLLGDDTATAALEKRIFQGAVVNAEGRAGYNVPSLYGLALGAPYLHHGQARDLAALLSDPRWRFHTNAGNANMSVILAEPGKADDLIAFLLSIDEAEPEIDVPADPGTGDSFDACPSIFP
ncbi:MAG TPA: cytochrome D1 domain-containing protein [Kofleriaceae bacterium]|nr:cytochrome D1 domain-containing protein [Kofleriaceae bacterium]